MLLHYLELRNPNFPFSGFFIDFFPLWAYSLFEEVFFMTIGDRIKEVRYHSRGPDGKKLTLEQFGEKIGLKRSTVSALETGAQGVTDDNDCLPGIWRFRVVVAVR